MSGIKTPKNVTVTTSKSGKQAPKAANAKVSIQRNSTKGVAGEDLKTVSREELEREVLKLREAVKAMKRGQTTDEASGLNNRATFLDIANAEFSRSRRYDHDLTLVVTDVIGLEKITEQHGYEALDQTMMAVGQMCLSSSRFGVEVLGRITENQIAIMLPETALAGGLKFMARMRKIITSTPIILQNGERVRPGMKVSADTLQSEDVSFMELFERTWHRTAPGKKSIKGKEKAVA